MKKSPVKTGIVFFVATLVIMGLVTLGVSYFGIG